MFLFQVGIYFRFPKHVKAMRGYTIAMRITAMLFYCLVFSSTALAVQINTCHCFKDRSFDAADPGKVDPYLLATTQNSFLASVFGIEKKVIVQAKMSGSSGNDLWVANYVAAKTAADVKSLMQARSISASWKAALSKNNIDFKRLGSRLQAALTANASDGDLAATIVDQMLIERLGITKAAVKKLRTKGASNKEIILSTFFSLQSRRSAEEYYNTVSTGQNTWGSHLNALGIKTQDIKVKIKNMIK